MIEYLHSPTTVVLKNNFKILKCVLAYTRTNKRVNKIISAMTHTLIMDGWLVSGKVEHFYIQKERSKL